jgi:pimeloyl-[acyl-carrier protein] methyl ester esterase
MVDTNAQVVRLHTAVYGSGPDIAMWHGWGMNLAVFESLALRLASRYRVNLVDLPGHGRSPMVDDTHSEGWIQCLMATLPARCTLLGWSLGAQFALHAATLAPQRFHALVLLGATPKFSRSEQWPHGLESTVIADFAAALLRDPQQTVADFLELQVRGSGDSAALMSHLRAALQQQGMASPNALREGLNRLSTVDLREQAARLRMPTVIVSGQHDRVTPPAASAALASLIRGSRLIELPRAAHAVFLSHPDDLIAAIDSLHCDGGANCGTQAL